MRYHPAMCSTAPTAADLVLASASPRRRQLLRLIGLPHRVVSAGIDEIPMPGEAAAAFALRAAGDKAAVVAAAEPSALVLAADTVVEVDGTILGKPADDGEAAVMLQRLSGRSHNVHTAIALIRSGRRHDLVDTARVDFVPLPPAAIRWYVASGESRDKAGAYAVQGLGGVFVAGVAGSPHTVVGLPLHRLPELFAAAGLDLWGMLGASSRSDAPTFEG